MSEKKRIAICMILSWSYIPAKFFYSYNAMKDFAFAMGYTFDIITARGAWIDTMRDDVAMEAVAMKPDYMLWLDADQTYPDYTAVKLAKHIDDGHLVVGGVTPDRYLEINNINCFGGKHGVYNARDLKMNQGLVKIDAQGYGGVMTHPSVFETIKYPRFQRDWVEGDDGDYYRNGEDVVFFRKCREAGIDCYCDTDLHFGHMALREIQVYE